MGEYMKQVMITALKKQLQRAKKKALWSDLNKLAKPSLILTMG